MTKFDVAREKYKPTKIKYLLIAEAPPKEDSGRFFYFDEVNDKDSLFIETMKVLYLGDNPNIASTRKNKPKLLQKFKNDGFFLIDSVDSPIVGSPNQKLKLIKSNLSHLTTEVKSLVDVQTKVILISATVYEACFEALRKEGINIINEEGIYFPGSGGQKKFREQLSKILNKNGVNTLN